MHTNDTCAKKSNVTLVLNNAGKAIKGVLTFHPTPHNYYQLVVHSLQKCFRFSLKDYTIKFNGNHHCLSVHKTATITVDNAKNNCTADSKSAASDTDIWHSLTIYFSEHNYLAWIQSWSENIGKFIIGSLIQDWSGAHINQIQELQSKIVTLCRDINSVERMKLTPRVMKQFFTKKERQTINESNLLLEFGKELLSEIKHKLAIFGQTNNILMRSIIKIEEFMAPGSKATAEDKAARVKTVIKCLKRMNLGKTTEDWQRKVNKYKKNVNKLLQQVKEIEDGLANGPLEKQRVAKKLKKYRYKYSAIGAVIGCVAFGIRCYFATPASICAAVVGMVCLGMVVCGVVGAVIGGVIGDITDCNEHQKVVASNLQIDEHNRELIHREGVTNVRELIDVLIEKRRIFLKMMNDLENVEATMKSLGKGVLALNSSITMFENCVAVEFGDRETIGVNCKPMQRDTIAEFKKYFGMILSGVVEIIQIINKFENDHL